MKSVIGRLSLSLLLALSLSGCATVFNGRTQTLKIASTQPATVTITDSKQQQTMSVTTPASVQLKGNDAPYMLRFRDAKGGEKSYEVRRTVSGWVFGNLLLGGIIGFGVDAATGSLYRLKPDTVTLDMKTGINLDFPEAPAKAP